MAALQANYPAFPGVQRSVDLLRRSNVQGGYLDAVLGDLQAHVAAHIDELVAAFRSEHDQRVRVLLLGVLAETGLPELMPFFIEHLHADDDLRQWALVGLEKVNTKEARRAMWEARFQGLGP